MTERTIVLDDRDAALLDRLVEAGAYRNADEAVHESLMLTELMHGSDALRQAALEAAIQVGLDDVAAGRVTRFASIDDMLRHFSELRRATLDEPER